MAKIVYEADEVFNWEDLVVDDPETVKLRDFGCRRKNITNPSLSTLGPDA